jgi:BirA family transcriptional regulator, biotin operon repressor / biotin---[acetyl-CoA-carboxylase] ligase
MGSPDHFGDLEWPHGWHVQETDETGSTNTDLLAIAATAPDRTVLRADHQTAGRGRLDRRWDAPPGANLLVSILFRDVPEPPSELTQRVGLAMVDAAREVAAVGAALKWPNDVLVGDAKLAGILAQRAPEGPVVVGAGVNLGWAPDDAARLGDIAPRRFLAAMLVAYDALPVDIVSRYRAALTTLGRRVRVERPHDTVVGTAVDVDASGRLIVVDECAISHHVDAGDVVHLRPG